MSSYRLQVIGSDTSVPISLKGSEWSVGRGTDNDIQLPDALVSRHHGLLYLDSDQLLVRDLGATNPIEVNGTPIQGHCKLDVGDVLLFGNTQIRVDSARDVRVRLLPDTEVLPNQDTVALSDIPPIDDAEIDERLSLVNALADALAPVRSPEDAATLTVDLLWHLFPCAVAVVARTVRSDRLQVLAHRSKGEEDCFEIPRSLVVALRREKSPICVRHPHAKQAGQGEEVGLVAFAAPLLSRGSMRGILYLEKDEGADPCTRSDLEIVLGLARILADRLVLLEKIEELSNENEELCGGVSGVPRLLGSSDAIVSLCREAEQIAESDSALTIFGEAGAGRETLARHVHSAQKAAWHGEIRPFASFDARARPGVDPAEQLFGPCDDEADRTLRRGKVAAAHEGTLCVRNVDSLPSEVQTLLVDFLSKGTVATRDGSTRLRTRLAVTSALDPRGLEDRLVPALRAFLGTIRFTVPPLREHIEDIPLLAADLLAEQALNSGLGPAILSPRAMDRLLAHDWPGNVAELRRVLGQAAILARGRTIYPKQLSLEPSGSTRAAGRRGAIPTLQELERRHIRKVLETLGGNRKLAAKALGIAESTLYERLRKHGLGKEAGPGA